jgi:hypothetical protein
MPKSIAETPLKGDVRQRGGYPNENGAKCAS